MTGTGTGTDTGHENGPEPDPESGSEQGPGDDAGPDPDKEALRAELGQIKAAMGLREEYPYWWRWWLVEGIGVGLLFPLIQFGLRDGFSYPLIALVVGVFLGHQLALWRILKDYEKPTTGVPSWDAWNVTLIAGILAIAIGFGPVTDQLAFEYTMTVIFVAAGSVAGVAYLFMGQLLEGYDIRTADRYAFYVGGAWLLVLVAVVPHVPFLREWAFAVLGIGLAIHNIGSYVVLSRV
ncbi:hypothetical protein OB955_06985 [Halobacteria archaeon AArc-m2/3/4]|uniref:DUF308 domain-containing protein n=1 Tax=Natronoglomus mannanivorans TaxID=2979990 RepID=A0ABT2QC28_9EURY|nr:hypothetical protein [Halobacteria archaeon AArc-m2/3/4]